MKTKQRQQQNNINNNLSLPRCCLSEDLELIKKRAMRIILPDYKYRDVLKMANINTLYNSRELLSLKLFNETSHTIDHKLTSLFSPRSKCKKNGE